MIVRRDPKMWSYEVTHRPPATFPPQGLYTKDAKTIYLEMRKPWISPNGLGSAIQMVIFFINRAGRNLPTERKTVLWQSVEYLRIELEYLRHPDGLTTRNEERFTENIQNAFAYALLKREFKLNKEPAPIHPPPHMSKRIGGRNGFNGLYKP